MPDWHTRLTALYVEIDDHLIRPGRRGPSQPKMLSDAELVCLVVEQVLLGAWSGTIGCGSAMPSWAEPLEKVWIHRSGRS
jgi:hypothetical protein